MHLTRPEPSWQYLPNFQGFGYSFRGVYPPTQQVPGYAVEYFVAEKPYLGLLAVSVYAEAAVPLRPAFQAAQHIFVAFVLPVRGAFLTFSASESAEKIAMS